MYDFVLIYNLVGNITENNLPKFTLNQFLFVYLQNKSKF